MVPQVKDIPEMQLTSADFRQFWIEYDQGTFTIGAGAPGCTEYIKWEDSDPIDGIRHVGLAAWDKFMAYRNIKSSATLEHAPMCTVSSRSAANIWSMHVYPTSSDWLNLQLLRQARVIFTA